MNYLFSLYIYDDKSSKHMDSIKVLSLKQHKYLHYSQKKAIWLSKKKINVGKITKFNH